MIYSKTCEYALRALSYLASKKEQGRTLITEIGEQTKVPVSYVAKIFQSLTKNGILDSRRGPAGGFNLKKAPEDLSLLEIVRAVDDINAIEDCVMGLDACSSAQACPLHDTWKDAKRKILNDLERCSLREFVGKTGQGIFRPCRRSRLSLSF